MCAASPSIANEPATMAKAPSKTMKVNVKTTPAVSFSSSVRGRPTRRSTSRLILVLLSLSYLLALSWRSFTRACAGTSYRCRERGSRLLPLSLTFTWCLNVCVSPSFSGTALALVDRCRETRVARNSGSVLVCKCPARTHTHTRQPELIVASLGGQRRNRLARANQALVQDRVAGERSISKC